MTEDSFNNLVDELSAKMLLLVSNRLTSDLLMLPGCAGWEDRIIPAWRRVSFSYSSSRGVINKFIDTVIFHLNNINLPSTDEELATVAAGWLPIPKRSP
jgi:hypothetical protein